MICINTEAEQRDDSRHRLHGFSTVPINGGHELFNDSQVSV